MPDNTLPSDPPAGRLRLTVAAVCGLLGAVCAGLGLPALAYLLSPPRTQSGAKWIDLGDLGELEPGTPRSVPFQRIRTDGWLVASQVESAWIVKAPDGEVKAFSPWCTHLGCAFGWDSARREFVCPCHDSHFAVDGRRLAGPALRGLDRYELRRTGNRLWLDAEPKRETSRS